MNKIKKWVAAALAVAPLLVVSGCRNAGTVYMAGLEPLTEELEEADSVNDTISGAEASAGSTAGRIDETGSPSAGSTAGRTGETESPSAGSTAGQVSETESPPAGYVYVCGAVCVPGVYPVTAGMRVFEVIALAGGFASGADEQWLNQAEQVYDGQRLYVYTAEETEQMRSEGLLPGSSPGLSGGSVSADGFASDSQTSDRTAADEAVSQKININTADKETLMTLPGIGESRADAVIAYRQEHGGFSSIEEIQNISGIKTAVFSRLKDRITV